MIPATGGQERRLSSFGGRPRWSPSGQFILFSSAATETSGAVKMYVVGANGGVPTVVQSDALANFEAASAAWAPDGRVTFTGRQADGAWGMVTVSITGQDPVRSSIPPSVERRLNDGSLFLSDFVWAPSGRHLYFEGRSESVRNIWRVPVDPRTLAWTGEPDRLTTGPGSDEGLAISPDGSRLLFTVVSARSGMWSFGFDPETGHLTDAGVPITPDNPDAQKVDVWSDGTTLVYRLARNKRQELWERSLTGGLRLLISETDWTYSPPRWSPDGTRVAYQRTRGNGRRADAERSVAVLAVNARTEDLVTPPGHGELIPSDWSSDGSAILAACKLRHTDQVGTCLLSLGEGSIDTRLRVISSLDKVHMFQQRFSPNQRWISFIGVSRRDPSVSAVYVMSRNGGPWMPITDGVWYDDKPRWSPDGRALYFVSNRDGHANIWGRKMDPDTGQPKGDMFRVTSFGEQREMLSPSLGQLDMNVSANRLFLPMYEASGQVWSLEHVEQ